MKKLLILFIFFNSFITTFANAAVTPGHMFDAVYQWPNPQYNVDVNFKMIATPPDTSAYYWAHFVVFQNSSGPFMGTSSRTAYAGLQTTRNGKTAIFSVWNALAAEGMDCRQFGGEGIGYQCKIPFSFQNGHTYRVRMWKLTSDASGEWWGAWVKDLEANSEKFIGQIKARPNAGNIVTSYLFDEYYTSVPGCSSIPYAKLDLVRLLGANGTIKPILKTWFREGVCANFVNVYFNGNDFTISTPR